MSETRQPPDFYQVLGVLRSATAADITAAYHLRARQCHPDVSEASSDHARFKAIAQAYETLSDEAKRRDYDRQIADATRQPRQPTQHWPPDYDARWIFAGQPFRVPRRPRADIEVELPITPEEAAYGGRCEFFLTVPTTCDTCQGRQRIGSLRCETCQGAGIIVQRRLLTIVLPRGLDSGSVVCVVGPSHWQSGVDLLLRIRISPCW